MSKQLNIFLQIFLLASILFFVEKSFSCSANSVGTVKCSKFPGGGTAVNSVGTVKCGKGACAVNSVGTVKCSKLQGGGAAVNSVGTVKCWGGFETGSSSYCETGSTSYCN